MGDTDIRRWFLKQPHKKESGEPLKEKDKQTSATPQSRPELKKTSKYFSGSKAKPAGSDGDANTSPPETKRKQESSFSKHKEEPSSPSPKKARIEANASAASTRLKTPNDDDDEFEGVSQKALSGTPGRGRGGRGSGRGGSVVSSSSHEESKTALSGRGRGGGGKGIGEAASLRRAKTPDDDDDDDELEGVAQTTPGRGRGGRGRGRRGGSTMSSSSHEESKGTPAGRGRGGGGGRGGAAFYQPRQTPPHKGEKEVPEGAVGCLNGFTFVISGTLDSLEREEAEDLIKQHGGRVTGSISKKTNYLLADEDIGGRKSQKAQELGVPFLTEDGLFDILRSSKPVPSNPSLKQPKPVPSLQGVSTQKGKAAKSSPDGLVHSKPASEKSASFSLIGAKSSSAVETEAWPQKYSPKSTAEMIGNQSVVKQLHDWLQQWFEQNLHGKQQKGKKQGGDGSNAKKAVLLSGPPGIGKTTSARLISKLLGFEAFEVNASDNRGKADAKVRNGISGSTANAIKEMVSNEAITLGGTGDKHKKAVLIMDEVDGMSGGDRGGVADLIASIKITKIPIICICNDRYSQKLKSLINYCLPLNFRKPTKQQMAKRLQQVAQTEGMQVDEIALEELAERVNGDMRMALNELQYMSVRDRVIKFNDVKARLRSNAKDEDMSPFNAVDRLMSYEGGRLRMDERLDASMSDPDLVPLLIQENYLNYCPALAGRDESGTARMDLIARSAACIADGDIVNVQIRQYQQWQHSQMAAFMSSIIPAALMHGRREILTQGERNFNRFGGWLGKNSSFGKKMRLLDDIHVHLLASRLCEPTRQAVRRDYLHVLAIHLTSPLKNMPKEMAVKTVVDFMEEYSLTQEDVDAVLDLLKFQGQPDPMVGVLPAVKAALTKAYKQRDSERLVRSSDLLPVFSASGQKQPKKRTKLQILPPEMELEEVAEDNEESADSEDDEANDIPVAFEANGNVQFNLDKGTSTSTSTSTSKKAGNQGKGSVASKRPAAKEGNNMQHVKRKKA